LIFASSFRRNRFCRKCSPTRTLARNPLRLLELIFVGASLTLQNKLGTWVRTLGKEMGLIANVREGSR
jgi:hypothetical protein